MMLLGSHCGLRGETPTTHDEIPAAGHCCWSALKPWELPRHPRTKKQRWNDLTLSPLHLLPSEAVTLVLEARVSDSTALSSRKMFLPNSALTSSWHWHSFEFEICLYSLGQLGCLGINVEPVRTWIGLDPVSKKDTFSQWFPAHQILLPCRDDSPPWSLCGPVICTVVQVKNSISQSSVWPPWFTQMFHVCCPV